MNNKLDQAGLKVVKLLAAAGFQAFWVGGIVRDKLLKRQSDNMDIATDAQPDDVEKILQQAKIRVKPVGKQFGSILAIVDSSPVEITTFRKEGRYSDKRHPDWVEFIKEYLNDAKRRDFTINALYFDPIKKQLYDPANGLKDIKGKLLRFVGDPKKRIDEDALRMLRGVRLATQLGFKLEKNSFAAIKTRAKFIQSVSGERVKAELDKILISGNRVLGIDMLDKTGLLRFIIPELYILKNVFHGSKKYHLEGSVFDHTKLVVGNVEIISLPLIYAALFHDIGKVMKPIRKFKSGEWVHSYHGHWNKSFEIFQAYAPRLRFSKADQKLTGWLIKHHDIWTDFLDMKTKNQLALVSHPGFELMIELWRADLAGTVRQGHDQDLRASRRQETQALGKKMLKRFKQAQFLIRRLARGNLIMKYSDLKPGKQLGQKIEDIKVQIILGKIKSEEDLKQYLK